MNLSKMSYSHDSDAFEGNFMARIVFYSHDIEILERLNGSKVSYTHDRGELDGSETVLYTYKSLSQEKCLILGTHSTLYSSFFTGVFGS